MKKHFSFCGSVVVLYYIHFKWWWRNIVKKLNKREMKPQTNSAFVLLVIFLCHIMRLQLPPRDFISCDPRTAELPLWEISLVSSTAAWADPSARVGSLFRSPWPRESKPTVWSHYQSEGCRWIWFSRWQVRAMQMPRDISTSPATAEIINCKLSSKCGKWIACTSPPFPLCPSV